MEVFKSKNGETWQVLNYEECPKHGRYIGRMRRVSGSFEPTFACDCPCCKDDAKSIEAYGQVAIPPRYQGKSFADYVPQTPAAEKALAFFKDYADHLDENIRAGRSIVLTGRPGTGKTHLACALAEAAKRAGHSALFTSVAKIIRNIRGTWGGAGSESQAIADYVDIDLLIIDEVGVQNGTENERILLFSVLNERYEQMRPTVVISNLPLKGMGEALGARALDRLRENGGVAFEFNWDSYRRQAKAAVPVSARRNVLPKIETVEEGK